MRHRCNNYKAFRACKNEASRLDRKAFRLAKQGCVQMAETCTLSAIEHRKAAARFSLSLYVCGCLDDQPPR